MPVNKTFSPQWVMSNMNFGKKFSGKTIYITGATGFLGSRLVYSLSKSCADAKIVAAVRNVKKAQEMYGAYTNVCVVEQDILDAIHYPFEVDYIIHTAAITKSSMFVENPIETIAANVDGTRNILEFAHEKKVEKLVFLSTTEIYGTRNYNAETVTEDNYGYVDILDVRSSYPQSKRLCETMCVAYKSQKQVPAVIARLCQVFGPEIEDKDSRMFAQFLRRAAMGQDIVLATEGSTVRGYCYIDDAMEAIAILLAHGSSGEAYTICNESMTMSVREVAQAVANVAGVQLRLEKKDVSKMGYLEPFVMNLSAKKIENLGWKPLFNMDEALDSTIKTLKNRSGGA